VYAVPLPLHSARVYEDTDDILSSLIPTLSTVNQLTALLLTNKQRWRQYQHFIYNYRKTVKHAHLFNKCLMKRCLFTRPLFHAQTCFKTRCAGLLWSRGTVVYDVTQRDVRNNNCLSY